MDDKSDIKEMAVEEDFEALLESSFSPDRKQISAGDKIDARVVSIGREYVYLDLGTRTEGLLLKQEVLDEEGEPTVQEGDQMTVYITAFRDGAALCGLRMGAGGADRHDDKDATLDALKEAFDAGMPVEGTVKESVKGGFSVTIMGQRAFCPISQIDNKYCESPDEHLNRAYGFEIIKFEENGRNIVVSRRRLLEAEAEEKAQQLWGTIKVDESYEGVVSSIRPYGAFVDIGGLEGLLHVSEISYGRVSDPKEVLDVGQKLTVSVKELDREKGRVSLSLKALMDDPWLETVTGLHSNQIVQGKVVRVAQFGAFVEITPGVEGLVHISEMGAERRIHTPREVVAEGQDIAVRILEIDPERKRISLSMNTEIDEHDWKADLAQSSATSTRSGTMGTFGDLLKDKIKR